MYKFHHPRALALFFFSALIVKPEDDYSYPYNDFRFIVRDSSLLWNAYKHK
jgi:hypothetical protein